MSPFTYLACFCVLFFLISPCLNEDEYCSVDGCKNLSFTLSKNTLTLKETLKGATTSFININLNSMHANLSLEELPQCSKEVEISGEICKQKEGIVFYTQSNTKHNINCVEVAWSNTGGSFEPQACISMSNGQWFSATELFLQEWPLKNVQIPMQPFVTQDQVDRPKVFGNILEPFWFNSNGVAIVAEHNIPLHVSMNEGNNNLLCLSARKSKQHYVDIENNLKFSVCKDVNIRTSYEKLRKLANISPPLGYPDFRMIKSPIWSTWARYKTQINETNVLAFADEIINHGFTNSQFEIDDMFSSAYGDFDFDHRKFPDPKQMVDKLKSKGFRVTVWITPFANFDSLSYSEGIQKGFWLQEKLGGKPATVEWWQGMAGIIDVTNPKAVHWFVQRLEAMKHEYRIDSFKFDAGETTYLPSTYECHTPIHGSNEFTRKYVEMVSRLGNMIEVRCGYGTQQYPVFVRMADKFSNWGINNGLITLIPTALTMSILGYPFVLPDMIGGNGYGSTFSLDVVLPERELYIRWLQISAYMPSMQFSFVPWDYDEKVVEIARNMVKVHEDIVTPIILSLKEDVLKGHPIIRPLWWISPEDPETWSIDSQFLVGDHLLVAPIVEKNAYTRNIYIPKGTWIDELRSGIVQGPMWLRNYHIGLEDIATFRYVS